MFLGRDSYRRRRLTDAARLLPVVGIILFMIPLMWGEQESEAASTARAGLYIFVVWIGLILAGYLLALHLKRTDPEDPSKAEREDL